MSKKIITATVLFFALSLPALASYAPIKYQSSREKIAASCALLGEHAESWGLDQLTGDFGCRDMENGNAVRCTEDGQCTDYSGDPRWKNIQTILQGGKPQRQLIVIRPAQAA